ncbi:hypothetical protein KBB08_02285 [Candidatus Gracilibacteria bacterium]|nr:hypothetical protein [Candidatus Gracilibacteria bacterium]
MTISNIPGDIGSEIDLTRTSGMHWGRPSEELPQEPIRTQPPGALRREQTGLSEFPERTTLEFGQARNNGPALLSLPSLPGSGLIDRAFTSHHPIDLVRKPKSRQPLILTETEQYLIKKEMASIKALCEPLPQTRNVKELCSQLERWQTKWCMQIARLPAMQEVVREPIIANPQQDLLIGWQEELKRIIADTEDRHQALLTAQLAVCAEPECAIYFDNGLETLATVTDITYFSGFGMLITITYQNAEGQQEQQTVAPERLRKLMTKPIVHGPREDKPEAIDSYIHTIFSDTPITVLSINNESVGRKKTITVLNQFGQKWTITCHISGREYTSHRPLTITIDTINNHLRLGENNASQFYGKTLSRQHSTSLAQLLNQPEPKLLTRAAATAKKWWNKFFSA